jgi:hypothetical protein
VERAKCRVVNEHTVRTRIKNGSLLFIDGLREI